MIKKYKRLICGLLVGIIILSFSYNIYQYNKIQSYRNKMINIVSSNIQEFARREGNIDDEIVFAKQFGNIVTAHETYIALNKNNGIESEEGHSSLSGLFVLIKQLMLKDKEKFNKVFSETEAQELMLKISDDFQDFDSIEKVYEIIID